MWSIFDVKLNYIVIFEKSCNSSTLLMELIMICGQLQLEQLKIPGTQIYCVVIKSLIYPFLSTFCCHYNVI